MNAERGAPDRRPAHQITTADDRLENNTGERSWPRPVREIRDDLVSLAVDSIDGNIDPDALDRLAEELHYAITVAAMYGGNTDATTKLARAVEETAELCRVLRMRHRRAA